MVQLNEHYEKLSAGYLFPEIAKRTKAFVEKNPGVEVLRLGIGNTTEPLVPSVIDGMHKAVDKLAKVATYTGYGDEQGNKNLREAIVAQYKKLGVDVLPEEVFVSDGAKTDSANIQSIFSQKSIVAVQDPAYPVYVDSNVISGRTGSSNGSQYAGLVYMTCDEKNNFFPAVPTQKVDLIYLCSPNNPTGAVATRKQLADFIAYAKKNGAVIFFDAAYSSYIKDPALPKSIYEIPGAKECAIEIHSFSKSAGFTGVRLGWTIVPKDLVVTVASGAPAEKGRANALWNRRQTTMFNGASNIAQDGGVAALTPEGLAENQKVIDYYMTNAAIIKKALEQKGFTVFGGVNAPYLWVKTPHHMSSWDFFDKMLFEAHVVVTPGSGFGPGGEGYFRVSAFGHRENIEKAVASILKNLKI